jgi:aspartate carbamoyltransferase regulatory subunit
MDKTEIEQEQEQEQQQETDKTIFFVGLNGRLEKEKSKNRVKAIIKEEREFKKRVDVEKWNLSEEFLFPSKQLELIKEVYINNLKSFDVESKLLVQQLERKISGYKQQDNDKKLLNLEKFINLKHIIESLISCELKCYYCNHEMSLLYEVVRELKQWTVDRVDNDLGHNCDNYVLACLECNLKRRRRSKDAYFFTKNLNIVKT